MSIVGILWVILTILPGMPFLILGALVLGHRSRYFRRCGIAGKRLLIACPSPRRPLVASVDRWSLRA